MGTKVSTSGPLAAAFSADRLAQELAPIVERRIEVVIGRLKVYPPELPNQRYVRTYDLRRGWDQPARVQTGRGRIFGEIKNPVMYAAEVQDDDDQRPIFAGRWRTVQHQQPIAERELSKDIDDALQRLLN